MLKHDLGHKNERTEMIFSIVGIFILSLILCYCALALTVMPTDPSLIELLFLDMTILFMNMVPVLGTMFILYFISNWVWFSFLFTSILVFIIAEVNRFKMTFRDEPFLFQDKV